MDTAQNIISDIYVQYFNQVLIEPRIPWTKQTFPFISVLATLEMEEHKTIAEENGLTYKELTGDDLPDGF